MIDISKLDKAKVLAALYNASHQQGMGFLDVSGRNQMTDAEAQELLNTGQTYFDYERGRVLKVDLAGTEFDPWLYDRDNGQGAAQAVIDSLN